MRRRLTNFKTFMIICCYKCKVNFHSYIHILIFRLFKMFSIYLMYIYHTIYLIYKFCVCITWKLKWHFRWLLMQHFPFLLTMQTVLNNKIPIYKKLFFVGMDGNVLLIPKYGVSLWVYLNIFANWLHGFELKELRTLHIKIMCNDDSQ